LSVVFIRAYLSFEFQFAFPIVFRHATTNLAYFELIAIRNDTLFAGCRPAIAEK
jgi:hypothetical protein